MSTAATALRAAVLVAGCIVLAQPARSDDQPMPGASTASGATSPGSKAQDEKPAWAGGLATRSNLLGDIGGIRPLFDRVGVSFASAKRRKCWVTRQAEQGEVPSSKV